ncbi:DUF2065 domain-containing protein [Sneathiella glossodoripedis]|uniref:DUF2065 domain-containing protein n=1 Tax=Sneathiella glossodoripedis TaxID=418853 RepID=UPI000471EE89|nr:DUF2065 domain-containing protein [Sneathiella glossodoripedis]
MLENLFLAGALVLFFEGALYALFPNGMKRMMISVLQMPSMNLRIMGLVCAVIGVFCVWLLKSGG